MTGRVDKYNQERFSQKIMLLYDGIHYDPLYWDAAIEGLPHQTIFQASYFHLQQFEHPNILAFENET